MSIREFVLRLEEYYGKWSSVIVLEGFLREVIKYSDKEIDRIFWLITKARPIKWGPPDLCCLMNVLETHKDENTLKQRDSHNYKKCPVCASNLRMGACMNCGYAMGDDCEKHRLWWENFKRGGYQDLHFDQKKITKVKHDTKGGEL